MSNRNVDDGRESTLSSPDGCPGGINLEYPNLYTELLTGTVDAVTASLVESDNIIEKAIETADGILAGKQMLTRPQLIYASVLFFKEMHTMRDEGVEDWPDLDYYDSAANPRP